MSKLTCTVDPTDTIIRLLPYVEGREILSTLLLNINGAIQLTPEELLNVFEASNEFKRADFAEMMTKDCKHWLTFAEQKQAAYKSGRPELLKDNEVFRQKAREAGIESEFDEVLKRSEDLEKKCINFLSNAF